MSRSVRLSFFASFLVSATFVAQPAWAQGTGAVAGTVFDETGAVLPGATVTPDAHTHGDDVHVSGVTVTVPEELETGFLATLPEFLADAYGAEE